MRETALLLSQVPPFYESNDSTRQGHIVFCGILLYKIEQSQDDGAIHLAAHASVKQ